MNKYRIVKLGDTDTYLVQKRFLWVFWLNRMGNIIPLTLHEARIYKQMFIEQDEYNAKLRKKNIVVE